MKEWNYSLGTKIKFYSEDSITSQNGLIVAHVLYQGKKHYSILRDDGTGALIRPTQIATPVGIPPETQKSDYTIAELREALAIAVASAIAWRKQAGYENTRDGGIEQANAILKATYKV